MYSIKFLNAPAERVDVTCNVQQAEATRDALAKGLYSRLFDLLVEEIAYVAEINNSLAVTKTGHGSGSLMPI